MEPTEDEIEDSQSSWESHPWTRRSQKYFEKRASDALLELLGKCAQSTDPVVSGAYCRYTEIMQTSAYFKPRSRRAS